MWHKTYSPTIREVCRMRVAEENIWNKGGGSNRRLVKMT
jgi:hypothetical protein